MSDLVAPFPYFGGKRTIASEVWRRLGYPKQYIEPFCGSAAVLLAAPRVASLEVVNDANGFIANFWRAVVHQPGEVARWADYPVSHVDLGARHRWLMEQRSRIAEALQAPDWTGDAKVAGWWLWGQCCWIGSGWCDWDRQDSDVSDAGRGVQATGQIPHVGNAGRGVQATGQIPHVGNAGDPMFLTSGGAAAWHWLNKLAARLERVRVVHGDWKRCLNNHYGADDTAVFLDPPYEGYGELYGAATVAQDVAAWCRENAGLRIALCGHRGDYDMPGWEVLEWDRGRLTYAGDKTTDLEAIWFSPPCARVAAAPVQSLLFGGSP
jgi:hypothetical protein